MLYMNEYTDIFSNQKIQSQTILIPHCTEAVWVKMWKIYTDNDANDTDDRQRTNFNQKFGSDGLTIHLWNNILTVIQQTVIYKPKTKIYGLQIICGFSFFLITFVTWQMEL